LAAKVFNGLSFIRLIANFFMGRLKIAIKNEIKIVVIWLYLYLYLYLILFILSQFEK